MSKESHLVACHDCDLLLEIPPVPPGGGARCPRCDAQLARGIANSMQRATALGFSSLVLYVVANVFPFLTLEISGQPTQTTIIAGAQALYLQGSIAVAGLVLFTAVLAPAIHITLLLYLTVPLLAGKRPAFGVQAMRLLHHIQPWSMAEVFMLGVLISMVKLADLAVIIPGVALWAFAAMIPVLAASMIVLDEELIWHELRPRFG